MASWQVDLLRTIGAPVSQTGITALTLWAQSEGMPAWTHNPLATTLRHGGGRSINSAGVQAYPSHRIGVEATALTLSGLGYVHVLNAINGGFGLESIWRAINASPWCRGCQSGRYPEALYSVALAHPGQAMPVGTPVSAGSPAPAPGGVSVTVAPDTNHDYSPKVRLTGKRASEHGAALWHLRQGFAAVLRRSPHLHA